jgi:hypothetical protein
MKSTPDSTSENQQPKNHGSQNRQPIAVLTHPDMYSAIITWQNNNTRQTQYSLQQTTEAPHTFLYPNSETPTMATNELWNVNTLELPSTVVAANNPSPSNATILTGFQLMLHICGTKKGYIIILRGKFNSFQAIRGFVRIFYW